MKKFIEFIIKALADHPERVCISEISGRNTIIVEVRCHPDDMGRIIGKNGKTVSSIRMLLSGLAAKHKRRTSLEVVE